MNRRSLLLTILSLTAAGITGAQAQTNSSNLLFQNGNMGSFQAAGAQGTIPTGWYNTGPNVTASSNSINSPFSNAYANNGSSFGIIETGGSQDGFAQNFSTTTQYQNISVNFDFMVPTLSPTPIDTPWGIQFDGGGVAGSIGSSSIAYRIDRNGKFTIAGGTGNTEVLALEAGAWYNVQANFRVTSINTTGSNGAGFQSGTITKSGDASGTSWTDVATLNTTLGYSRLLVRDRSGTQSGGLLIDNVSVVPEPSEYALMALGLGLTTLVILRRRKEGQAS
jgi:hypothetical protein